ncbi:CD97 antigen [Corchorus olitorius]|uniref:CD97 antigen n=1 Tax=Corchorus olitorius TaxID=93759 RepID=A0A1R3ITF1_9ROSI|nr:CD97 antigen [Corchorus olitorius]
MQCEKLLEGLVDNEEIMAQTMQIMKDVLKTLLLGSALFVIKGILRPVNGRKGSAHRHLNVFLNVTLSIIMECSRLLASGVVYDEGYVGKVARFILALMAICFVATFKYRAKLREFIHHVWFLDLFNVGDVIKINNVEHEVVDIKLKGDGS